MTKRPFFILLACATLVTSFVLALRTGLMPLGVAGEWEWLRLPIGPSAIDVILAAGGVLAYACFALVGMRALTIRATVGREGIWLAALLLASLGAQTTAHSGAPYGYGLAKWVIALHQPGSGGYFSVARSEITNLRTFLAGYPEWVRRKDSLHIGTHPPGLIAFQWSLLKTMRDYPAAARFVEDHVPESVEASFRIYGQLHPMTTPQRATLALTGMLTLLSCSGTVIPLYLLARSNLDAPAAWATATLWPLIPSAILFQPTADTAFPLLSTSSFAIAVWPTTRKFSTSWLLAALFNGLLLGVGMQLSLVFLPVGLIVALLMVTDREDPWKWKLLRLLATGVGFLGLTLCLWLMTGGNPFLTWWWNQRNHARFYTEFPRSYRAWVVANPIELAVAVGLPVTVWACLSVCWLRKMPRVSLATAVVLTILTLGGRNLSEVARIWLPFMPPLLLAAGHAMERSRAGPASLGTTVALIGVQTLALEATIQVVYAV
ncbi:MAG: hypothetical protein NVSMB9_09580 [Isosphaeraceae bacterium]